MTIELKSCPFCEQPAEIREWDFPYVRFQVRCSYCRAMPGGRKAIKADAIAAWNTRASTASEAERVREACAKVAEMFRGSTGDHIAAAIRSLPIGEVE